MASGDPTGDAIVLWTRATPPRATPGGPVAARGSGLGKTLRLRWELAYDQHFRRYGPADLLGKRDALPATRTIDLEGYRLRHALHEADPDLQLAHRRHQRVALGRGGPHARDRGRSPRASSGGVRGVPGVDALPLAVAAHGRPPGHPVNRVNKPSPAISTSTAAGTGTPCS
ncbi:MAG: PhoD-like phosphatase N-terminal domain-containing protein [Janthinobacterium lividum]